VAAFCDRLVAALGSDDEDAGGGFDDVVGDGFELVDLEYSADLGEEAFEESEVASGDAFDGGDGLGVGEVVGVEGATETFPVAVEDEEEFVAADGSVAVGEAEAAVELGVVAEALVDSGHPDEDHGELGAVVPVAQHLQGGGGEPFGFVDDEKLDPAGRIAGMGAGDFPDRALMVFDADAETGDPSVDVTDQFSMPRQDFRGVEDGTGTVGQRVVLGVVVAARSPRVEVSLEDAPLA
jgi:hypothetical protein